MKSVRIALWLIFIPLTSCQKNMTEDMNFLENLMEGNREKFDKILTYPERYKVQVIYTQINRDKNNTPSFKSFEYGLNPKEYFYPASTVKMPVAFLALEKLNKLNIAKLNMSTPVFIDSAYFGQTKSHIDATAENGLNSIGHYIKKVFLVSDNDAFNRLYEFVGPEEINASLRDKDYPNSKIRHRLSVSLTKEENRYTNPMKFKQGDSIVYEQGLIFNEVDIPQKDIPLGKGYLRGGVVQNEPMNFGLKNVMPLLDLHEMLKSAMFPESVNIQRRFSIVESDYKFLYKYMSQFPSESTYPNYTGEEGEDAYCKFILYGAEEGGKPKHIRIFNKVGIAYGFVSDHAYVVDFENKIEFLLSAVIHVNENQIYNDGEYEYDEIGFPFMKHIGEAVYRYELNRERTHEPDLSRFKCTYD